MNECSRKKTTAVKERTAHSAATTEQDGGQDVTHHRRRPQAFQRETVTAWPLACVLVARHAKPARDQPDRHRNADEDPELHLTDVEVVHDGDEHAPGQQDRADEPHEQGRPGIVRQAGFLIDRNPPLCPPPHMVGAKPTNDERRQHQEERDDQRSAHVIEAPWVRPPALDVGDLLQQVGRPAQPQCRDRDDDQQRVSVGVKGREDAACAAANVLARGPAQRDDDDEKSEPLGGRHHGQPVPRAPSPQESGLDQVEPAGERDDHPHRALTPRAAGPPQQQGGVGHDEETVQQNVCVQDPEEAYGLGIGYWKRNSFATARSSLRKYDNGPVKLVMDHDSPSRLVIFAATPWSCADGHHESGGE